MVLLKSYHLIVIILDTLHILFHLFLLMIDYYYCVIGKEIENQSGEKICSNTTQLRSRIKTGSLICRHYKPTFIFYTTFGNLGQNLSVILSVSFSVYYYIFRTIQVVDVFSVCLFGGKKQMKTNSFQTRKIIL